MRYKFGIGRIVLIQTNPDEDCPDCTFKCKGKQGKIIAQHMDFFPEGYTVQWDGGECLFSVEELRRVK